MFSISSRFTTPRSSSDLFIWGEGYLSYFTKDELTEMKNNYRKIIMNKKCGLKFADHGAYSQDRESIKEWEDLIRKIEWWELNSNPG